MYETLCSSTLSNIEERQRQSYATIRTHGVCPGAPFLPSTSTSLKCWHCVHAFSGVPCQIPMHAFESAAVNMLGNFCSWSCAVSWIIERKMHTTSDILMHVNVAASKQNVKLPIARAPPTYFLEDFGGCMSIDQFRAIGIDSIPVKVLTEPCLSYPIAIEGWKQDDQKVLTTKMSGQKETQEVTRGLYHEFYEKHAKNTPTDEPTKRRRQQKVTVRSGPLASFIRQPTVVEPTQSHPMDDVEPTVT